MAEDVGFWLVVLALSGGLVRHRWRRRRWRVSIRTLVGKTYVEVHHGRHAVLSSARIAVLPTTDSDYDQRLSEAEAAAFDKCAALNASERVNKHR
jgi:hypothetical protein